MRFIVVSLLMVALAGCGKGEEQCKAPLAAQDAQLEAAEVAAPAEDVTAASDVSAVAAPAAATP